MSTTLGVPVEQVVAEQEVVHSSPLPSRRAPVISKSPWGNTSASKHTTTTRAPAGKGASSYDMTPARHELPPEPLEDQDNYGLDDLNSDGDTDDEDNPRKEVPKWAEGTALRTAFLKQCYMPPDIDAIFAGLDMPDLSTMFHQQRKRFFKRTSKNLKL